MVTFTRILKLAICAGMISFFAGCAATPQRQSTGEYVDDAGITTRVKTSILQEPGLKVLQIDVTTYKGVVQLSGFVDSEDSIRKAGQVAGNVEGVKSVINNLVVKPK